MLLNLFTVALGAFLGGGLRYLLSIIFAMQFPLSTLLSNVLSGFLGGLIIGIDKDTMIFSPSTKLFLTTGFLGGLSTLSGFSLETLKMFENNKYFTGSMNIFLNLGCTVLFLILGLITARLFTKVI
ncbi:MAG: fluoride efflux transporter FluC [Bacilli bacterium]